MASHQTNRITQLQKEIATRRKEIVALERNRVALLPKDGSAFSRALVQSSHADISHYQSVASPQSGTIASPSSRGRNCFVCLAESASLMNTARSTSNPKLTVSSTSPTHSDDGRPPRPITSGGGSNTTVRSPIGNMNSRSNTQQSQRTTSEEARSPSSSNSVNREAQKVNSVPFFAYPTSASMAAGSGPLNSTSGNTGGTRRSSSPIPAVGPVMHMSPLNRRRQMYIY